MSWAMSAHAAARLPVMETRNGTAQINSFIPLSNMFGYATDLRSKTQGRGSYSMEPSHFAEIPKSIAQEIAAKN